MPAHNSALRAPAAVALVAALAHTATAVVISTAVGNGADVQLTSASSDITVPGTFTDTSSNGQQMNTRFNVTTASNPNTAVNDIIALRFDLSGYDLTTATDVSLSLFSYRDDTSNRSVQVYGVTPGAVGKDNNGTISGFNSTNWNEATVKFSTMPGLEWDNSASTTDFDLDPLNTTLLGSATFTGAALGLGTLHSISGTAFADFLHTHTGTTQVTLLLRAGALSNGQGRFGTKESTGLNGAVGSVPAGTYAPYLTFTAVPVPEPSTYALLSGVAALAFSAGRRRRV